METDNNKVNQALETLPNGFARHQVVLDDQNNPTDYIFLKVNAAFEEMTGLKRENILGRKVTEVLPGIEKGEFDSIGIYGKVAQEGKSLHFEQYSESLKRWYEVQVYSDEAGFFTTVFNEITKRKEELASMRNLLELTEKLFNTDLAAFDYQSAADNLLKLSGAKFAAINTYEDDRTKTVTRAISGIPSMIERASKILGFKIAGQAWEITPERLRKIEGGKLVRFSSLYETAMGSLNKTTATMLHKLAGIGDSYVFELAYGGRETTGDIIFFMPKNKQIENREAIELYAGQLGAVLGRLRSEEKLLKNEQRLSLAQVNVRAGYWEYNIKQERLYWSRECEALFGLAEGEFEGTFDAFLKQVHPEDKEYVLSMNQPITESREGTLLEYEHRIIKKDGTVLWVRETADTVYDEKGEAAFVTGFVMDITDRKQVAEAISESEHRFNLAISGTGAGLWDWDMINDKVFFSTRWKTMLGYADHEIENAFSGRQKLWHPEDAEEVKNAIQDHLDGKTEKYEIEHRVRHKNGSWRNILTRGDLIKDENGKPVRWVGTNIDLTHIKQMEEELRESEARLNQFFSQSLAGFFFMMLDEPVAWDETTDKEKTLDYIFHHQRMTKVNQAMLDQYGATEGHLIGKTPYDLFKHDLKHGRYIWRGLFDQGRWQVETNERRMDGTPIIIDGDYICLYDSEGCITGHFGVQVDITEKKEKEKQLQDSEQRLTAFISQTPAVIYAYTVNENVPELTYINDNVVNVLGYKPDDFIKDINKWFSSVHPDDQAGLKGKLDGTETQHEYRFKDSQGNYRWLADQQRVVLKEKERIEIVGAWWDITDRKQAEEALRTSEMRSKALIEAVPDMLFRYNQDGVYLDVQVNNEKLLHGDARELYRNNALIGKSITDVLPSPVDAKLTDGISKALVNNSVVIQEYSYMVEDEEKYFEARLAPSGDNEVVSIVRDATERIRNERELKYISLHDQLTGLYNRHYFENELKRLDNSREHPIAVISADLDGLKLINDTLGHSEGDRYLQAGADLLKNALRESDV